MSVTPGIPIDIRAEYGALTKLDTAQPDRDLSAHEELGGLGVADDRLQFVPFAESYIEDPRKQHLERGLGELGIISVTGSDLLVMRRADRHHYVAAMLGYQSTIERQSRVLRTPGNDEADWFQRKYPGADDEWAASYGDELGRLHDKLSGSKLFALVLDIDKLDHEAVLHARHAQERARHADRIVLQRRKDQGTLVTIKHSKLAA